VTFVVGVDEKMWDGSGLFENCNSLFRTQGAVFGSESFDCFLCSETKQHRNAPIKKQRQNQQNMLAGFLAGHLAV